jgi:transposase
MSKKQSPKTHKAEADAIVRNVKRQTRCKFNSEEKICIVLAGIRGEESVAELCRQEGIHQNLYYRWSREFLEAGKKRLEGDTMREASTSEVKELRKQNSELKEALAEEILEHRLLKKSDHLAGEDGI